MMMEAIKEERKQADKKDLGSLIRKSSSNPTPLGKLTSDQLA